MKNNQIQFPTITDPTKEKVLIAITEKREVQELCLKIAKNDPYYSQELYSELLLALAKTDENKLVELYKNNQLHFYIARILTNTFNSNSSSFFYKIKQGNIKKVSISEVAEIQDEGTDPKQLYLDSLERCMKKLDFFKKDMLQKLMQFGTITAISKHLKSIERPLNEKYISKVLKEAKAELKRLIEEDLKK